MGPLTNSQRTLVEEHLKLVKAIARARHGYLPAFVELDDVEQAGRMGLIYAALKYDGREGSSFETFARYRINGAISDFLRKLDPVSKEQRAQIKAGDADEVAHVEIDDRTFELRSTGETPEEAAMALQFTAQVRTLVEGLSGRQRHIVEQYYYQDRQQNEIARDLGCKGARVSQLHKAAVETLRSEAAFVERLAAFRFALSSGIMRRMGSAALCLLALAFAPQADAQTPLDATGRGCRGNAVQVVLTVPLAAGAITVPVPVCATLGPGLTLNTAVNPPRLEVAPVAMPRAVIERFSLPPDLPATQTTVSFTLKNTPTGAILGGFRSSRVGGEVVDFLKAGAGKVLVVKVPSYRPFTADDELAVLYWTLEAE